MSRRHRDLALASTLVVLLALHALGKVRAGLLPEMLWGCHLATLLGAIGIAGRLPRLTAIAFLFHVGIGIPGLALEVIATRTTTATSVALHVLTPIAALLALDALPRTAILDTWLFYLAMQPVGWLAPAELNVNVAHRPWDFLPWATGPWVSRTLNAAAAMLFLLGAFAVTRRGFDPRPSQVSPST